MAADFVTVLQGGTDLYAVLFSFLMACELARFLVRLVVHGGTR